MAFRRVNLFTFIVVCLLVMTSVQAQEPPTPEPPTAIVIPTDIPTLPPMATDLPTLTPLPTELPPLEPSFTPLPLPTETETATITPSATFTDTPSLEPSLTATASSTASATASATASLTPSLTASATAEELVGAQNVQALNVTCDPSASIQQANVSSTGEEGNVSGNLNSLSADGRYLYFPSRAANLVVGDTNNMVDYFEFDRTNCQTRRITVGSSGEQGDGDSDVGNISGNGQYFAFASKASNFAVGDTNGKYDIFVKNLQTDAVTRIPADPDNLISTAYYIGDVTISDDGRFVAFDVLVSAATPSGFSGTPVLYDLQSSTRTVIASEGRSLYISGNGNYIAFESSLSNLVAGDTNSVDDVFIYDRVGASFTRASVMTDGTQSFFAQEFPSISISGDGRYVSFTSLIPFATNDTNNASDVYVRDRINNTTTLVSLQNNGTLFAAGGLGTRLSADGRYVVFITSSGVQVRDLAISQTYLITNAYPINGGLEISADGAYLTFSTGSGTPPNDIRNVYVARRLAFALPTITPTSSQTPATGFATCAPSANLSVVSVSSSGTLGNGDAGLWYFALSNNARYVYYVSSATNLVAGDTNLVDDIFRFDRETCQTIRVSTDASGNQANNTSSMFGVSENGQVIVFGSSATNLVAGDPNGGIFVRNLTNNTIIRIPNSTTSGNPSISADGRYVAYTSPATASSFYVMLYDTQTAQSITAATTSTQIQWAKISSDGSTILYHSTATTLGVYDRVAGVNTPLNFNADLASLADISANGRYIVFVSDATNLVPNDTNAKKDTFVYDRQTSQFVRTSVSSAGAQTASNSGFVSISPDGRYVSFVYNGSDLVLSDTNNTSDLYVRDLVLQRTYLVSTGDNGQLGNNGSGGSWLPFSSDNQYLVFPSGAGNLIANDLNVRQDVFITKLLAFQANDFATATAAAPMTQTAVAQATQIAAATATKQAENCAAANSEPLQWVDNGTLGNGLSRRPYISSTGRYVAFESSAPDFVIGDTNNKSDVFVFDRETCRIVRASVSASGVEANNDSMSAFVSANGRYVAFVSLANNLTSGDSDNLWDAYVKDLQTGAVTRLQAGFAAASSFTGMVYIADDNHSVIFRTPTTFTLYDLQSQQQSVLVTSNGLQTNVIWSPLSSDLRYFVFSASDAALVSGDTNNVSDVYLLDRQTSTLSRISVSTAGIQGDDNSGDGIISANGRYVVFTSYARNFANDTLNNSDVFVRDLLANTTTRVSVSTSNIEGNGQSGHGSVSADGRYVVFLSESTNLVSNDTNESDDVFVRDLVIGETYLIPRNLTGSSDNYNSDRPVISGSGDYVTFAIHSKVTIPPTNLYSHILVAKRSAFAPADIIATQTAVAQATATAAAPMTQTAVAQVTATYVAATQTAVAANTIVVNTTSSSTSGSCNAVTCTLPQAVARSNSMIGVQTITFNIPGTGVKQIFLSDSLRFTSSAILDASTQPGYAGSPLIEIVPYSATSPVDGIVVNGANPTVYDPATSVTIRGVAIGGFVGGGILLGNGQSHVVEDSYIGTNAAGTEANGNDTGIFVRAPNSIIRNNLISGNNNVGLYIYSNGGRNGNNNSIVGNFIGTDVTGEYPLPNSYGIRLTEGALNNVVGGATLADANLISANLNNGILIDGNSNANVVAGNIIGLDATGDYLLGNGGTGIYVSQATNTVIGGDTPEAGNEIWGNLSGIAVINQSDNTIVRNNVIAQNGSTGISVLANGTQLIENVVAFHTNAGVTIGSGTGNRISMNRVYSNGGMGIDLGGIYSVLPNDVGDVDNGANGLQNYPVITSVVTGGGSSTITGSLSSKANSTYRVEFFTNAVCDATGYGEGQTYLGYTDVTTNANGVANFSVQYPPINSGATFGINWSAAFFASSNLTGTAVNVSGINGLNFNWGSGLPIVNGNAVPGMPADNFSARFTSTQSFAAGTYNFVASSDDGVRVYIDGVLRLDKFFGRPLTTDQFSVTLTTGTHNLVVEYFEGIDTASLQLNWSLNGGAPNVVTSTATDALGNTSGFSACRAVQTILGVGSIQETSSALIYQGNWVSLTGAGNGGGFKYTTDPNARVSFWVDSSVSRVTFYRTIHPAYGSTQIFLDNGTTPFATMVNTSATIANGVPYTIVLPAGGHRIELRNVGTAYSSLDQIDLLGAAATLQTGTYQDTDANLTFVGNWVHNPMAGAYGGSRRYTNDPNGRVIFNIDNSVGRILVYRTLYQTGSYGSMQILVDGALTTTMPNNPSSTVVYGVPFAFEVTPGSHTIEFRNVGSTYSDIDQIVLLPAATPMSVGTFQEADAGLTYSGNWTSVSNVGALGGSRRYTNDPNARVFFYTDSSVGRVTIYRTIAGSTFGSMQVYVDGTLHSTFANNTSTTVQYGVPNTFLVTPGTHRIELRNVGTTFGDIDQLVLQPAPASLGVGVYQETDSELIYMGNWTSIAGGGALGGSRRYTNDPLGRAAFNIDSSVGKVTIYRTVAGSSFGTMQVYVDGVLNSTIANNTASAVQYGVPFTILVTPGNHTVELRNVGNKFGDLDQITLEAPTAALGIDTYQETNAELTYIGNWTSIAGGGALGGTRRYTNDPSARVSFNVDSTVGRVTIYRTIAGSTFGAMQVYVDGVLNGTIANNTASAVQYGVPYTFPIAPGNHTIELRNTISKFSDLDQIVLEAPTTALGVNTYQETTPELSYAGNWTNIAGGGALGGTRRYTNDPNARVSFNIDSSVGKVTIYRTVAGSTFGTMQVYVDGVLNSTIANNTSSTVQFGVPYTFAVIPGNHLIELRNGSATFSDIDQIMLDGPPAPLTVTTGTYQESSSDLIYVGSWTTISHAGALGGSRRYTNQPSARVSFTIDSSVGKITIYRTVAGSTFGTMQVYIDGMLSGTIANNTSSSVQYGVPYSFTVVPGNHTIELRNGSSTFSDLDQIVVEAS